MRGDRTRTRAKAVVGVTALPTDRISRFPADKNTRTNIERYCPLGLATIITIIFCRSAREHVQTAGLGPPLRHSVSERHSVSDYDSHTSICICT